MRPEAASVKKGMVRLLTSLIITQFVY